MGIRGQGDRALQRLVNFAEEHALILMEMGAKVITLILTHSFPHLENKSD